MKPNLPSHFKSALLVVLLVLAVSAGGLIPKSAYAAPGDLFVSVNLGGAYNGGSSILQYTPAGTPSTFASNLDTPRGLAFDSAGNLFVATTSIVNQVTGDIRGTLLKITPDGTVSTFATGFDLNCFLQSVVIDSAGNIFVMAQTNSNAYNPNPPSNPPSTIYKVTPDGAVSRFGLQSDCIQSDGSNCSVPGFSFGLALDSSGNLFAADQGDQTIYQFTPEGVRSVFVGPEKFTQQGPSGVIGPVGLAFDRFGYLFVSTSDTNAGYGGILKFAPDGTETTLTTGLTNNPRGIAFDPAGNLFVAEPGTATTGDILEFTPESTETFFAQGIGIKANRGAEYVAFQPPHAIPGNVLASISGRAFVPGDGSIFQYTPAGIQMTFISDFDRPRGLAFDGAGNFFVATNTLDDSGNFQGTIFKITPGGMMSTFATGFGTNFFLQSVVIDSAGNVFVMAQSDANGSTGNPNPPSTIYKITPGGTVSTFGSNPGFSHGLAFDSAGNLFAADNGDQTIFKFTPEGVRSIVVGPSAFAGPSPQPSPAPIVGPVGLAFDGFGNLFVSAADGNEGNGEILKFTPDATKTTWTETTFFTGLTNGPRGLAFDGAGNLFVAEIGLSLAPTTITGDILEFTAGGAKMTFASNFSAGANRGPQYLAFPPGETPVGSNVMVNTGTVGAAVIALTFPQVTVGGTTTVTPIDPNSAGTLPSGYELIGGNLAFEITTTATYTTPPPIIIAFQVPSVDATTFSQLRVLHNESGTLVDRTASNPAPNPTTQTIYASVSSLSPFVIAKLNTPTNMNQCKNGGWQTHLRANGTRFNNQGDCIQYVNTGK